ncbi:MAG: lytic transglycosylase domain-containing protein [Betaproteobacteria bacterium]
MSDRASPRDSPCPTGRPRRGRVTLPLLALLAVATPALANEAGRVFQVDDTPGEIHLTDDAAGAGRAATLAPARAGDERRFDAIVLAAARHERLDLDLLRAVVAVESRGQPDAVSPRGATGLMQLMPATARAYGLTDAFDPTQNVAAGAHLLRALMDRYHQDVARALAAYNAGAPAIDRWHAGRDGWPSAETTAYVPRVLAHFAALRGEQVAADASPPFQP